MVVYNLEIGNYNPGEDVHDFQNEKEEIVEYIIRDIVQAMYYEGTWAKGSIYSVDGNNLYSIRFYKTKSILGLENGCLIKPGVEAKNIQLIKKAAPKKKKQVYLGEDGTAMEGIGGEDGTVMEGIGGKRKQCHICDDWYHRVNRHLKDVHRLFFDTSTNTWKEIDAI